MRAMILSAFGGPENFAPGELERPVPGPGEVLVRVMVSGTNPVEAKLRADGTWAQLKPPVVLGYDAAGVVEALGPGAQGFAPGAEVFYTPEIFGNRLGTYAEYNVVPASLLAHKPRGLSFEEAAAIPLAGGTAWEAVIRRLRLRPGETVLIQGGAGGVGSFAVQFAKAAGARVLASAGPANQEFLRELGADHTIDYSRADAAEVALAETGGRGVDAVFDIEGDNLVARSLPALRAGGRIACILPPQGDLALLYQNNITLYGTFLTREGRRLEEMRPLFERHLARPIVDQVLPLADVAAAHERLDSRHGRGKVVLQVA